MRRPHLLHTVTVTVIEKHSGSNSSVSHHASFETHATGLGPTSYASAILEIQIVSERRAMVQLVRNQLLDPVGMLQTGRFMIVSCMP